MLDWVGLGMRIFFSTQSSRIQTLAKKLQRSQSDKASLNAEVEARTLEIFSLKSNSKQYRESSELEKRSLSIRIQEQTSNSMEIQFGLESARSRVPELKRDKDHFSNEIEKLDFSKLEERRRFENENQQPDQTSRGAIFIAAT